jgi:hypothetical protein
MSPVNMMALFTLLPLLALASPLDRSFSTMEQKRAANGTTTPLSFQQVSSSIGISAQMVRHRFALSYELRLFCIDVFGYQEQSLRP